MKRRADGRRAQLSPEGFRVQPRSYIFFDKSAGTERFEVRADADGNLPTEQAASLMAVHCLMRGRKPQDFSVMVAPGECLLNDILPMAKRLVQACVGGGPLVHLSPRQRQVLRALLQDLSNKEIAAELHVSVRTVKFHVSTLLEKFGVHSRSALMRKAADMAPAEISPTYATDGVPTKELPPSRAAGEYLERPNPRPQPELLRVAGGQRSTR